MSKSDEMDDLIVDLINKFDATYQKIMDELPIKLKESFKMSPKVTKFWCRRRPGCHCDVRTRQGIHLVRSEHFLKKYFWTQKGKAYTARKSTKNYVTMAKEWFILLKSGNGPLLTDYKILGNSDAGDN